MSNHPVDIIPTVVSRDHDALLEAIRVVSPFSRKIHVDIDDGLFTPHLSWPYIELGRYGDITLSIPEGISAGAHLMVREPRTIGIELIKAGVRSIIGHIEACTDFADAETMLTQWRAAGASEVGLAILTNTPLRDIELCVRFCDVIQVMSIATIGVQGAPFDPRAVERIRALRAAHPDLLIAIDGGVSLATIADLVAAGATRFGVGSAISKAPDPAIAYQQLLDCASHALRIQ